MSMTSAEMIELCKRHSFYTWAAQGGVSPIPVERAEGVSLYTPDGERILDFNSQLMSVNIGHSHPKVVAAMKAPAARASRILPLENATTCLLLNVPGPAAPMHRPAAADRRGPFLRG